MTISSPVETLVTLRTPSGEVLSEVTRLATAPADIIRSSKVGGRVCDSLHKLFNKGVNLGSMSGNGPRPRVRITSVNNPFKDIIIPYTSHHSVVKGERH